MTRGNPSELQPFDPKIDRTFHRESRHPRNPSLHAEYSVTFPDSSDSHHIPDTPHSLHSEHTIYSKHTVYFEHFHTDNMAQPPPPHERTMSELTAPEFTYDKKIMTIILKFYIIVNKIYLYNYSDKIKA